MSVAPVLATILQPRDGKPITVPEPKNKLSVEMVFAREGLSEQLTQNQPTPIGQNT